MQVDGNDFGDPARHRVAAGKTPAIARTIADCNHPFGAGTA